MIFMRATNGLIMLKHEHDQQDQGYLERFTQIDFSFKCCFPRDEMLKV